MSASDLMVVFVHPELQRGGPIRLEAEHMLLESHGVKHGGFASGGSYVQKQTGMTSTLYMRLPLSKGSYDVVVGYFDESDGQARQEFDLSRGDILGDNKRLLRRDWRYDQDLPGTEPSQQTAARKLIGERVPLQSRDALRITTFYDKNEAPSVDYIESIHKD